jgi:hypothetical protein
MRVRALVQRSRLSAARRHRSSRSRGPPLRLISRVIVDLRTPECRRDRPARQPGRQPVRDLLPLRQRQPPSRRIRGPQGGGAPRPEVALGALALDTYLPAAQVLAGSSVRVAVAGRRESGCASWGPHRDPYDDCRRSRASCAMVVGERLHARGGQPLGSDGNRCREHFEDRAVCVDLFGEMSVGFVGLRTGSAPMLELLHPP